jgi:hypothetical protein
LPKDHVPPKPPLTPTKDKEPPGPGPSQPVDSRTVMPDDVEEPPKRKKRKEASPAAEPAKEQPAQDAAKRDAQRLAMIRMQRKARGKGR